MSVETSGSATTTTVGGRTIAWTTYGDPSGRPVVYFHGAGGSRLEGGWLHDDARDAGLRIISIDRPGCGRTDPMPHRTLLRSVTDLPAVLEIEDVDTAAVAGLSAGAMYAWAAAEAYRDRITNVVAVSPAMNIEPHADVRAALSAQFKLTTFLATRAPGVLAAMQRKQAKTFNGPDGQAKRVKAMRKISPDDATLLEGGVFYRDFSAVTDEGRRQGHHGGEEFALIWRPWGFDPAAQSGPCTVIYGTTDPLTPAIRAWLTHAPHAAGREVPGGHLQTATPTGRAAVVEALLG